MAYTIKSIFDEITKRLGHCQVLKTKGRSNYYIEIFNNKDVHNILKKKGCAHYKQRHFECDLLKMSKMLVRSRNDTL